MQVNDFFMIFFFPWIGLTVRSYSKITFIPNNFCTSFAWASRFTFYRNRNTLVHNKQLDLLYFMIKVCWTFSRDFNWAYSNHCPVNSRRSEEGLWVSKGHHLTNWFYGHSLVYVRGLNIKLCLCTILLFNVFSPQILCVFTLQCILVF